MMEARDWCVSPKCGQKKYTPPDMEGRDDERARTQRKGQRAGGKMPKQKKRKKDKRHAVVQNTKGDTTALRQESTIPLHCRLAWSGAGGVVAQTSGTRTSRTAAVCLGRGTYRENRRTSALGGKKGGNDNQPRFKKKEVPLLDCKRTVAAHGFPWLASARACRTKRDDDVVRLFGGLASITPKRPT